MISFSGKGITMKVEIVHKKEKLPARFMAQFTDDEAYQMDVWGLKNRVHQRSKILRALALKGLEATKYDTAS